MPIPVCYCPPHCFRGDKIVLPDDEARHVKKVLRLSEGDDLIAVDGEGKAYFGKIITDERWGGSSLEIETVESEWGEPRVHVTLAFGMSVGNKPDEIVETGTELGVSAFVPLVCGKGKMRLHSEAKELRQSERLTRVAIAAMKQCRRSRLPELCLPVDTDSFFSEWRNGEDVARLLFHPPEGLSHGEGQSEFLPLLRGKRNIVIVTGPESGFLESEIEAGKKAGFHVFSLGKRILRAEHAAPAACALILRASGELG